MFTDIVIPMEIDHGGQFNFPITIKTDNGTTTDGIRLVLSSIRAGDTRKMFIDTFENVIKDQKIEQIEIDRLYKKFPNLELLGITFYQKDLGYNTYHQGFLGRMSNVTIEFRNDDYVFIFGNEFSFNCEDLNNIVQKKSNGFNIFINRFLPDLLDNNKFNENQQRNIEKFMFHYI